jgi:hypothetical protein
MPCSIETTNLHELGLQFFSSYEQCSSKSSISLLYIYWSETGLYNFHINLLKSLSCAMLEIASSIEISNHSAHKLILSFHWLEPPRPPSSPILKPRPLRTG